eukprot:m.143903 g.143903  ORF g.143903 m.143903 type:complete len:306 (+) comp14107_c0_seq2:104-1021(+)
MAGFTFGGYSTLDEQLRSLSIANVSHRPREITRFKHEVDFTAGGHSYTLDITLPRNFPEVPPHLAISPQASHPWIPDGKNINGWDAGFPWTSSQKLGQLVEFVIRHLKTNPPMFLGSSGLESGGGYQQQSYRCEPQRSAPSRPAQLPPQPDVAAVIKSLSYSELETYAERSTDTMPCVTRYAESCDQDLETFTRKLHDLAQQNLKHRPELERLEHQLQQTETDIARLEPVVQTMKTEYDLKQQQFSKAHITTMLQSMRMKADGESQDTISSFQSGEIDLPTFIAEYTRQRQEYHLYNLRHSLFTQ